MSYKAMVAVDSVVTKQLEYLKTIQFDIIELVNDIKQISYLKRINNPEMAQIFVGMDSKRRIWGCSKAIGVL